MANETAPSLTPASAHRVWASYVVAGLCAYVFMAERRAMAWGIMGPLLDDYAFQWTSFLSDPWGQAPKLITCTFLHADLSHLVGNMLFFLFFAPSVERVTGGPALLGLYFGSGAVASLASGYFQPFVPHLIGASGSISGVMGAYFVLFPLKTPSVCFGVFMGRFLRNVPAFVWIGLWFLLQIQSGIGSVVPNPAMEGASSVAYWAHVGGFVVGALAMLPVIFKR